MGSKKSYHSGVNCSFVHIGNLEKGENFSNTLYIKDKMMLYHQGDSRLRVRSLSKSKAAVK